MRWELVEKALEVVRRERFVHARKLARRLGINTRSAGHILKVLRERGAITTWTDRRGRFKVYKVVP